MYLQSNLIIKSLCAVVWWLKVSGLCMGKAKRCQTLCGLKVGVWPTLFQNLSLNCTSADSLDSLQPLQSVRLALFDATCTPCPYTATNRIKGPVCRHPWSVSFSYKTYKLYSYPRGPMLQVWYVSSRAGCIRNFPEQSAYTAPKNTRWNWAPGGTWDKKALNCRGLRPSPVTSHVVPESRVQLSWLFWHSSHGAHCVPQTCT